MNEIEIMRTVQKVLHIYYHLSLELESSKVNRSFLDNKIPKSWAIDFNDLIDIKEKEQFEKIMKIKGDTL